MVGLREMELEDKKVYGKAVEDMISLVVEEVTGVEVKEAKDTNMEGVLEKTQAHTGERKEYMSHGTTQKR